jgi:hypothetical protein
MIFIESQTQKPVWPAWMTNGSWPLSLSLAVPVRLQHLADGWWSPHVSEAWPQGQSTYNNNAGHVLDVECQLAV